jgi:hypothetical protein
MGGEGTKESSEKKWERTFRLAILVISRRICIKLKIRQRLAQKVLKIQIGREATNHENNMRAFNPQSR